MQIERPRTMAAVGGGLWLVLVAEVTLLWMFDAALGQGAFGAVTAEVFTGREGGIPVAVAANLPPLLIWQLSVTQDLGAFFVTYPVFLHLLHRYQAHDSFLMRRLRRVEAAAARHQAYAHRWGPLGLFLFMLVPFLVNGPLVGGVLGRLAGIHTRWILLPVIAASMVAAALWVFLFEQTLGRLEGVDPRLGFAVAGSILVFLIAVAAISLWIDEKHAARARAVRLDEEE